MQARDIDPDWGQSGSTAQQRFDFQDSCAAYCVIESLFDDDFIGVLVEFSTDIVVLTRTKPPELVSIKTREPNQQGDTAWGLRAIQKSRVLTHLHDYWKRSDETVTVSFRSDAGVTGDAARIVDWHRPGGRHSGLLASVVGQLGCTAEEGARFLDSFTWPASPLPRRREMRAVIEYRVRELVRRRGLRPLPDVGAGVEALLIALRSARSADPWGEPRFATAAEASARAREVLFEARFLSAQDMIDALYDVDTIVPRNALVVSGEPVDFIGRERESNAIRSIVSAERRAPIVLHGPPGIGKTALALRIGRALGSGEVLMLSGAAVGEFVVDLRLLDPGAHLDDTGTVVADVRGVSDAVFVADGLGDHRVVDFLLDLAARPDGPIVLATSTSDDFGSGCAYVVVDDWSEAETERFVTRSWPMSRSAFRRLRQRIGGNPLAWEQAADGARLLGVSPDVYASRLDEAPRDVLAVGRVTGHEVTVLRAVELLIDAAGRDMPDSIELLRLLSFVGATTNVRALYLERQLDDLHVVVPLPGSDRLSPALDGTAPASAVSALATDPARRLRALLALARTSLVEMRDGTVAVSRTVGLVAQALTADARPYLEVALSPFLSDVMHIGRSPDHQDTRHVDRIAAAPVVLDILRHCDRIRATGPAYYVAALLYADPFANLGWHQEAWRYAMTGWGWVGRTTSEQPPTALAAYAATFAGAALVTGHAEEARDVLRVQLPTSLAALSAGLCKPRGIVEQLAILSRACVELGDRDGAQESLGLIDRFFAAGVATSDGETAEVEVSRARLRWLLGDLPGSTEAIAAAQAVGSDSVSPAVRVEIEQFALGLARFVTSEQGSESAEEAYRRFVEAIPASAHGEVAHVRAAMSAADRLLDDVSTGHPAERAAVLLAEAERLIADRHSENDALLGFQAVVRGRLQLVQAASMTDPAAKREVLRAADGAFVAGIARIRQLSPVDQRAYFSAALINHAQVMFMLQREEEAVASAEEGFERDRRLFGDDHPETVQSLAILRLLRRQR